MGMRCSLLGHGHEENRGVCLLRYAQFNKLEDIVIDLATDPAANNGKVRPLRLSNLLRLLGRSDPARPGYKGRLCVCACLGTTRHAQQGTVAVCMIAAEITTISNVALLADTALANVIDNYWGIQSAFTTIDTSIISNSCITLDGMCMLSAKVVHGQQTIRCPAHVSPQSHR